MNSVGIITVVCALGLAGLTHTLSPVNAPGVGGPPKVRTVIRWSLPATEVLLAVVLLWAIWTSSPALLAIGLALATSLFLSFALYVDRLRRRNPNDVSDCECTAIKEPASVVGVVRALFFAIVSAGLLVWPPSKDAFESWTLIAGMCGGVLCTYVPALWNLEFAQMLRLQGEHDLSYQEG